jgi:hypothetical protein
MLAVFMSRIVLIQPLKYREYTSSADVVGLYEGNTAFGFLSHFLKSRGHEVIVADANLHEDYIGRVMEFGPDLAGVRFEGYETKTVCSAIQELRRFEPNAQVVVGGPATMLYQRRPEVLFAEVGPDFVVFGDGIPALHEIALGNPEVPGVCYRKGGGLAGHGVAPYQVDLWQTDPLALGYDGGAFRVVTSMGCPYRCSFCDERIYTPESLHRPMERVLADLVELDRVKRASQFALCDPIFLLRKGRLRALDEGMRRLGLGQRITFQTRADRVLACLEELEAARGRIARVDLGVESFVQTQLDRWDKRVTAGENVEAVERLRALGLFPFLYLIAGDLETDEAEFGRTTAFFLERPEYLLITQPSGLVQYHDARDLQYGAAARTFEWFFQQIWHHIQLAWSESALDGFRNRRAIPQENQARLAGHFQVLQEVMRGVEGSELAASDRDRLAREGKLVAMLLGSLYESNLEGTVYGLSCARRRA